MTPGVRESSGISVYGMSRLPFRDPVLGVGTQYRTRDDPESREGTSDFPDRSPSVPVREWQGTGTTHLTEGTVGSMGRGDRWGSKTSPLTQRPRNENLTHTPLVVGRSEK